MRTASALLNISVLSGAALTVEGLLSPPDLFDWEKVQLSEGLISNGQLGSYLNFAESAQPSPLADRRCRVFPGDPDWPSADVWKDLNTTLNGALIKAVPAASPCYKQTAFNDYDESKCNAISGNWSGGFNR